MYTTGLRPHLVNVPVGFQETHWFPSFQNMLEVEGLSSVLPGIESVSEGIK